MEIKGMLNWGVKMMFSVLWSQAKWCTYILSTRCLSLHVMIAERANLFLKAIVYMNCVSKGLNFGIFKNGFTLIDPPKEYVDVSWLHLSLLL